MGSKPRVVVENLFLLPCTSGNQGSVTNILRFISLPVVEVTVEKLVPLAVYFGKPGKCNEYFSIQLSSSGRSDCTLTMYPDSCSNEYHHGPVICNHVLPLNMNALVIVLPSHSIVLSLRSCLMVFFAVS